MNGSAALERLQFETQALVEEHPPQWRHRNKQIVHAIACPPGTSHGGSLNYSRWSDMAPPEHLNTPDPSTRAIGRAGFYDYEDLLQSPEAVEWHVNFADRHLFVAYSSPLFAQDEMQVAEHPALASLKEALVARGHHPLTIEGGRPTPVLVMGAERRCRVATEKNALEGRPNGLYGNAFARASEETVRRATVRIEPPTITNLIAMAAPSGGYGRYTAGQIEFVLLTAFTAFRAAIFESVRSRGQRGPVVVHTGFWGCGAFGGNRVLMAALQVLAARMAGLDVLAFHTGDASGDEAFQEANVFIEKELSGITNQTSADLIERITLHGFEWGVSDGN